MTLRAYVGPEPPAAVVAIRPERPMYAEHDPTHERNGGGWAAYVTVRPATDEERATLPTIGAW
jgi:hypothetical protein